MTNYRDRGRESDFEFEFDIDSLYEFEVPTPAPAPAPSPAPNSGFVNLVVLDQFAHGSTSTPTAHDNIMKRIAHLLVASHKIGLNIRVVELVGHADSSGSDTTNLDVARKRAEDVGNKLKVLMDGITPGSSTGVRFDVKSKGESQRVAPDTPAGNLKNRRVDLNLPRTCQAFFADYELQFEPGHPVLGLKANPNIDQARRISQVQNVVSAIFPRFADRAAKALTGNIKPALAITVAANPALYADVQEISKLQVNLFKKYHPGTALGFNADGLNTCFQMFANGLMRSPHLDFPNEGVTEPNGRFFFLFAEFGFLCAESGIDVAEWTAALRAMIGAQEIFMHVYRKNPVSPPPAVTTTAPSPGPVSHPLTNFSFRRFSPLSASNVTRGKGQSGLARRGALTRKYAAMNLIQLRLAAAQNLLRAQTL